jgi:hypothetical protein
MASTFPNSIDNFTDPLSTSPLNSPSHSLQHANLNDAVEKIETNLSRGKIAANYNATNYGLTTANVGYTVSSLTGTITAGRMYLVSAQLVFQPYTSAMTQSMLYVTGTGITTRTLFYQGGASTPAFTMAFLGGSQQYTAAELGVTSGSASVTINLVLRTNMGGYVNEDPDGVVGANSARANFRIEDIGFV